MGSLVQLFRSRKNEKAQFFTLLKPHVEIMHRMAYRWTQNSEDAEDLVQDVLSKLAQRTSEMAAIEQLRPWLLKILYRRFVDLHRSHSANPVRINSDLRSEDTLEVLDYQKRGSTESFETTLIDQERLQQALACLEADQRDTILLHDVEGYTALEAAEILGVSVGTVKSRVHRGRAKLKKILQAGTF